MEALNKFKNLNDIREWAGLYNEYFIRRNNKLNYTFASILKIEELDSIFLELKEKIDFHKGDILVVGNDHTVYFDWWEADCISAHLTDGTKPVDWMKKRLLTSSLGAVFFQERESKRLKEEAEKIKKDNTQSEVLMDGKEKNALNQFKNINDIKEWANLYNEYFIHSNNKLNYAFASILKLQEIEQIILKLNQAISFEEGDIYVSGSSHKVYFDWWKADCISAYLTDGTKPVDWMKKRLLSCSYGQLFLQEKESKRLKKEAEKIPQGKVSKAGIIDENAGYVYVIRDMDTGLFKIGETSNWRRRFKELKVDDENIVLIQIKWVSNRFDVERYHHDLNKDFRLPQSEWFKLSKVPKI